MNSDIVDRVLTIAGLELCVGLWMLNAADTPLVAAVTVPGLLALAATIGVVAAGLCWRSWPTDRANVVVRVFGVLLLVVTATMALLDWTQSLQNASLACVGAVLAATPLRRRRFANRLSRDPPPRARHRARP